MGIAISAGAGLIMGVALLIWGLRQKNARHAAERSADKAEQERKDAVGVANANSASVARLEEARAKLASEVMVLRDRLGETYNRLAECGDPEDIKAWLDSELKAEEL